jgi:hypothetical protein
MPTIGNRLPRLLPIACFSALALAAGGCAGASTAREMSATSAKITNDFKIDTQSFFAAQDLMMQGVVKTISERKQLAADSDDQTRIRRAAWQAANNTDAIRIYDSMSAQSDTAILASSTDLQSLHPLAMPAATTVDPKAFDSVTGTLNQMAKPPSLKDQITFLVNEGQDVSKLYKQSLSDGAKCANKAAGATKQPVAPQVQAANTAGTPVTTPKTNGCSDSTQ